jgi:hypothetical protein
VRWCLGSGFIASIEAATKEIFSGVFARATTRARLAICARDTSPEQFPPPLRHLSRQGRALCTISEYWKFTPELPDASSAWSKRRQPSASLHGVVFDILAARSRDPRKAEA